MTVHQITAALESTVLLTSIPQRRSQPQTHCFQQEAIQVLHLVNHGWHLDLRHRTAVIRNHQNEIRESNYQRFTHQLSATLLQPYIARNFSSSASTEYSQLLDHWRVMATQLLIFASTKRPACLTLAPPIMLTAAYSTTYIPVAIVVNNNSENTL